MPEGGSTPSWLSGALDTLAAFGPPGPAVIVKLDEQTLYLIENGRVIRRYPVSTSRYGAGSEDGSHRTPLGVHRIAEKIGAACRPGEILKGRVSTGEIAEVTKEPRHGVADRITTRILWLEGLEGGRNRGAGVDSYSRYIYIHGTPEEGSIGRPASIGCVRMTNAGVMDLFERVGEGVLVYIIE